MPQPTGTARSTPHAWQRSLFWKMLGADFLLVAFTAAVFPGAVGERLAVMVAALLLASLVLNLVLTPTAVQPLHAVDAAMQDRQRTLDLTRRSLSQHEEQRSAIASQLRERVGQDLAALSLEMTAAIRRNRDPAVATMLEALQATTARLTEDVGAAADEIYPGLLSEFGLLAALTALTRRVTSQSGVNVRLRVEGAAFTVPLAVMRALLLVSEEAIDNAVQHAGGSAIDVTLTFSPPRVMLEVADDGAGFDVAAAEQRSTGIGLFRARELLAHAGGTMQIQSSPGSGTRIVATSTVPEGSLS